MTASMSNSMSRRGLVAGIALAACFTGYSVRLVYLQVTMHETYVGMAAKQNAHTEPIYARRGEIFDIKGVPLAQNDPVRTVVADGSLIKDPDRLAQILAAPLEMPVDVLRAKLSRKVKAKTSNELVPLRYIVLKKGVSEIKANEVSALLPDLVATPNKKELPISAVQAIRFERDFVRVYPNASLACHVIGFVNDSGVGMDGIESSMNDKMQGRDGYRFVERNGTGGELVLYRGEDRPRKDGSSVTLTIDLNLQQIVENELDVAMKTYRPKNATVVMMNPFTGEIMALANRPDFNPNAVPIIDKKKVNPMRNIAITDQVEPGSTFKVVTVAAALSEKLVNLETDIQCENGYWQWCKLHDHSPYASLSVRKVLIKSSNIGAAKIGMQLGDQRFYEYARKFGFGDTLKVNLPGEIRGALPAPESWDHITLTRMPMGQSVAATPLQITTAMCAIANGGMLMIPQIVHQVTDEERTTEYKPQERWRVVSKRATEQVREALVEVVGLKGTALLAAVPGFKVAGKTGTAQKPDEHGHMNHEKYVVSFVGFMPAENPAFVMLVIVDEAKVDHENNYGGKVAAPIFSRIAAKAARYLDLQPTEPIPLPGGKQARSESSADVRDQ